VYNLVLFLPFPPTINHYYVSGRARQRFVSAAGSTFRGAVGKSLEEHGASNLKLDIRLNVEVILYPPDKRTRDLDNYMKSLLDALTYGGLWTDDGLIDQLAIFRGENLKGGLTKVEVNPAGPIVPR
jgi:crossover junction endodeoxyribonuclease RusA